MDKILEAINDYILANAKPVPAQEIIYRGYQNSMALPDKAQDFIIIAHTSPISRVGTNVGEVAVDIDGKVQIKALHRYQIAIDICNVDDDIAAARAVALSVLGRSSYSVEFFKPYDLCFLYSEDIGALPYVDEFKQYIHRYRIIVHLSKWQELEIQTEYFEKADLSRIENVDTHHKIHE